MNRRDLERQPLTPWTVQVPAGTVVELRTVRFPGRDHPRVVVSLVNWTERGMKRIHLTRPVAYASNRGIPAWIYRALSAVRCAIDGLSTPADLATLAEIHHQGRGIRRSAFQPPPPVAAPARICYVPDALIRRRSTCNTWRPHAHPHRPRADRPPV